MTEIEFRELVKKMRWAQKEYFKTRDKRWLNEAKKLESAVDYELVPKPEKLF